MNNENSVPIADLFELNKRVSLNLWHMANEHGKPSNLSPHVIYPFKRDRTPRISEQEARVICCGLLNNLSLYYSVETPTEKTYRQSGGKYMSARTDLTIYTFDGQSLHRAINIEFKGPQSKKEDVGKDVEKLVREGYQGNWFHILANYDAGTFPSLFSKFKYAFMEYPKLFSPENFSSKTISIIFCFCVLQKRKAYMRHFSYEPSQNDYSEYVTSFFDASNLNKHWYKFAKNDFENKVEQKISIPPESTKNRELVKEDKLKWERVNNSFDLRVVNYTDVNVGNLRNLLKKVEANYSDYKKPFSKDASKYLRQWFDHPDQPLKEDAYCLLSNWFLNERGAGESIRAYHAGNLWDVLFCARPDRYLTDWRISGRKVVLDEFGQWWPKQLKCQKDC